MAHVLYDLKYHSTADNANITATVTPKEELKIHFPVGTTTPLALQNSTSEASTRALFDLAVAETSLKTPCFIPLGYSDSVEVGQHLISIGFPGVATSQVLYEGFLSSRSARLPLPFGRTEAFPNRFYAPNYEVLRVQMPITPGASGSPIISDSNKAIGMISEAPIVLTKDVQNILQIFGGKNISSGTTVSGFDITRITGELAWIVAQFESPGAGLAVPVSNLSLSEKRVGATQHPK